MAGMSRRREWRVSEAERAHARLESYVVGMGMDKTHITDEPGGWAYHYPNGAVAHVKVAPPAPGGFVWWYDDGAEVVDLYPDGVIVRSGGTVVPVDDDEFARTPVIEEFVPWAEAYPPEWRTDPDTGDPME